MLYPLKTIDEDGEVLINPKFIVRIYQTKGKVSLCDGSVLRVGPSDLERLILRLESSAEMPAGY